MLEFKDFKMDSKKNSSDISIKFSFIDKELGKENTEYIFQKLNEYEVYLEYDCKGDFQITKNAIIEMIITFPGRKVPNDKKELEKFVNKYVMDFNEYYHKISSLENLFEEDLLSTLDPDWYIFMDLFMVKIGL